MPRFSRTGLRVRPARFSSEKFCMLRAPIWITSAYSSTRSSALVVQASVTIRRPNLSRISAMILSAVFAHPLKGIRGSARLIGAAAEELRSCPRDLLGHGKRLLPGFNRARPGNHRQVPSANGRIGSREANDCILLLYIAAHQLVGLRNPDHFSNAGKFFEVTLIDRALLPVMPMAVRCAPGMGWARKPSCSMCSQTACISSWRRLRLS